MRIVHTKFVLCMDETRVTLIKETHEHMVIIRISKI